MLSASSTDSSVAWYENLGGGAFGPRQVITGAARGARSVHATDLDGDGDIDVLAAAFYDDTVAWYRAVSSDTDRDALPEAVELCITGTDPALHDTDGGGVADGEELFVVTVVPVP